MDVVRLLDWGQFRGFSPLVSSDPFTHPRSVILRILELLSPIRDLRRCYRHPDLSSVTASVEAQVDQRPAVSWYLGIKSTSLFWMDGIIWQRPKIPLVFKSYNPPSHQVHHPGQSHIRPRWCLRATSPHFLSSVCTLHTLHTFHLTLNTKH